jgi:F-type H+-transporting ATPase subunit a
MDIVAQLKSTELAGGVFTSMIVMLIMIILAIYIGIRAHFHDPLKKPKGMLLIAEMGVTFFEDFAEGLLGKRFRIFGGYLMAIGVYLFLAFIFGLTGLPSPMTTLSVPLSLGLSTFILIHATAAKYNKIRYFKRYVEPLPFFLPVNLISMWAPLLSLTLRLFGNALSGFVIMNIVYYALQNLSAMVFAAIEAPLNEVFIAPFIAWILHLYFDLFSGFIQTTVFLSLTTIYVGQETPDDLLD